MKELIAKGCGDVYYIPLTAVSVTIFNGYTRVVNMNGYNNNKYTSTIYTVFLFAHFLCHIFWSVGFQQLFSKKLFNYCGRCIKFAWRDIGLS